MDCMQFSGFYFGEAIQWTTDHPQRSECGQGLGREMTFALAHYLLLCFCIFFRTRTNRGCDGERGEQERRCNSDWSDRRRTLLNGEQREPFLSCNVFCYLDDNLHHDCPLS